MRSAPVSTSRRRLLGAAGLAAVGARAAAMPLAAGAPSPDASAAAPADPADSFQRRTFVTSDGVRLSMLEAAPAAVAPGSPTLVLVPGWCMPAFLWRAQLAELGARCRTIAFDPRGQGESDVAPAGYTADRRADDLHELLGPLERVTLVGWSLGGLEALHYVHRHATAKLAALVLVDNSVGEPPAPAPTDFLQQLRKDRQATLHRFVRAMFAQPLPDPDIERIERAALRMKLQDSVALLSYPLPREHWRRIARDFDRPLAYCVTRRYLDQARNLERERPATRIEYFENAGHALFVDQAPRFNRLLGEMLSEVGG